MVRNLTNILAILLLLLACATNARIFHSRDAYVRGVIASCQGNDSVPAPVPVDSECQPTLKCILNTVDQATQGRWGAGASILVFIPSIAAVMSNSIDDVVLVSEEHNLLALALSLCSFTAFPSRFGGERNRFEATEAIKEELHHHIMQAYKKQNSNRQSLRWPYHAAVGSVIILLSACCALMWYAISMISTNGVVVFSCEPKIHIPIWIALAQLLAFSNVLLKSVSMRTEKILLCQTTTPTSSQDNAHPAPKNQPQSVILRDQNRGMLAQAIRAITSILSLALFAFATAVLSGMTMFPASDGVRVMVMIAANAGMGRIIGRYTISQDHGWKTTVVIDVAPWQIVELKRFVEAEVQNAALAVELGCF